MRSGLPLERAARLVVEEERLRALPTFKFELITFSHDGHAEGLIVDEDRRHPIRIEFDSTFPFRRPKLLTTSDDIKALRHVNRAGEICTLRAQPDDWNPDCLTAADLVSLAWKLIINQGDLEPEEDDAVPEPVDFEREHFGPVLLAHEEAKSEASTHGTALVHRSTSRTNHVLLSELRDEDGDLVWCLSKDIIYQYLPSPGPAIERVPWFRATEPPPYSMDSIEDLERIMPTELRLQTLLTLSGAGATIKRKQQGRVPFLIQYEDESGSRWAFVETQVFRNRSGRLKPASAPRYLRPFTIGNDAFFGRIDGLLDRDCLQGAHVVLIGVGAIGSRVAMFLNQSGVGRITSFDGDSVNPGNPVRGQLPFAHLGLAKVDSVELNLRENLPTTQYRGVPASTVHPDGQRELERVLREDRVDLCVVAIGHHNDSRHLDRILAPYRVPRIYTWTTRGAASGVVLALRPDANDAAPKSYEDFHKLEINDELPELPEEPESLVPNVTERGCAAPALPGTPIDITTVALHASQTAIDLLLDKPVASYQYWTRQERAWSGVTFDDPISPLHLPVMRPNHSVREVLLSHRAEEAIRKNAELSPEKETGGILAGYSDGEVLRIEYASGPGQRSHRTQDRLVLDDRYAQGHIDAVGAMSGGQLRYTGEWHTHPTGDLIPSPVDQRSLHKLATSPGAGIEVPVILVAGLTKDGDLQVRAFTLLEGNITEMTIVGGPDRGTRAEVRMT